MPPKKLPSFYAEHLDEAERRELRAAANVKDLDQEITLLRMRIKELASAKDPAKLLQCLTVLSRLITTRYTTTKSDKKGIAEAFGAVLKDIALPLGIILGKKL